MNEFIDVAAGVADALAKRKPVVALESTLIAHGMPWPDNYETARQLEQTIADEGAAPATIALLGGRVKIGLDDVDLRQLAEHGEAVTKCSRRDLPYVIACGLHGATTVAATMLLAELAGIRVFATGGIGGVHRDAATTMDISADLTELARTSVAVVCAGAKSILDLGLTLEYLETEGVPVVGYGTDELPAFYTRYSGLPLQQRLDTPQQVAAMLKAKWALGLAGGVVIANPIPAALSLSREEADTAIEQALRDARLAGITGKETTPFLLRRINELTGGDSLSSNRELVLNNARLAARISGCLD